MFYPSNCNFIWLILFNSLFTLNQKYTSNFKKLRIWMNQGSNVKNRTNSYSVFRERQKQDPVANRLYKISRLWDDNLI